MGKSGLWCVWTYKIRLLNIKINHQYLTTIASWTKMTPKKHIFVSGQRYTENVLHVADGVITSRVVDGVFLVSVSVSLIA